VVKEIPDFVGLFESPVPTELEDASKKSNNKMLYVGRLFDARSQRMAQRCACRCHKAAAWGAPKRKKISE
jgi:hypothetical protein